MGVSKKRSASPAAPPSTLRIWPSRGQCLGNGGLVVGGTLGALIGVATGQWLIAIVGATLVVLGARLFGWVEVRGDVITQKWLVGETAVVAFDEVREVGFGIAHIRNTKLWYPQVETLSGDSVKFTALTSKSGTETMSHVEEIFAAGAHLVQSTPEDEFTTITTVGDLELQLTPGYDAYRRAQAQQDAAPVPTLSPEPVRETGPAIRPSSTSAQRRLRAVGDGVPQAPPSSDGHDAPEVFTPAPLSEKPKRRAKITPVLVPPPVPIAVVRQAALERYKAKVAAEEEAARSPEIDDDAPFVSLFTRAA